MSARALAARATSARQYNLIPLGPHAERGVGGRGGSAISIGADDSISGGCDKFDEPLAPLLLASVISGPLLRLPLPL